MPKYFSKKLVGTQSSPVSIETNSAEAPQGECGLGDGGGGSVEDSWWT